MTAPRRIPIGVIVGMLAQRAEALARHLFPAGSKAPNEPEWRIGSLAGEASRHGFGRGSLNIRLSGPKAGIWKDFATGEAGDALDLIAQSLYRGDKGAAVSWALDWLGFGDGSVELARGRDAPPPAPEPEEGADASETRGRAQAIYLAGQPIDGTPVDAYLAGRGLEVRRLGFPVRSLRYHPRLWNTESHRHWPAMVAAIVDDAGKFLAVHRTWLDVSVAGVRKAPLLKAKKCYGPFKGGAIRIWRGIAVDPDTGEIRQARRLSEVKAPVEIDLVEGIEDGLTVALAYPEARVLAAVSVSNMANLRWGSQVSGVVFWKQNDEPNSSADLTAREVIAAIHAQGKRVRLARPPWGTKDVNDLMQEAGTREVAEP